MATFGVLRSRAAGAGRDARWWHGFALAMLGVGILADGAARILRDAGPSSGGPAGALVFSVCVVVACGLSYQVLMRWNRVSTQVADPGDWLNGISAVLTLVGLGNLAVRWSGSALEQSPWWQLQPWLFRLAALVVLLGATVTAARLSGSTRDVRLWVMGACWALVIVSETAPMAAWALPLPELSPHCGWLLAIMVVGLLSVRGPTARNPQPATAQAPTIGALVVLLASAGVLILDGGRTGLWPRLPSLYAGLAIVGTSARIVHLIRDLAQLAQTRRDAMTDDLTGIANRRALMAALDGAAQHRGATALLSVDLDRFKDVNDRYGHSVGDELLRQMASRLREQIPVGGLLARLGGDEFAVLLRGGAASDAQEVARCLSTAAAAPLVIAGRRLRVGASIGVVATSVREADGRELLRRADVAMYAAKGAGGGVSVYDEVVDAATHNRAVRLEELRAILDPRWPNEADRQLVVHYQPQVDVHTGRVVGAEALVRWQHPQLGLLGPAAFLELAEEHGLMAGLTAHVLRHATAQATRWRASGRPLRVAVNLSTSVLADPDFLPLLDDVLADTGIEPASLVLEITETTLMADPAQGLRTTHGIARRGVGISIDDYGTGYSSLAYLNDLPATELKLDRSFTSRALADERTAAIVGATIELAHRLGLRLIAEGVEDEATLHVLRLLGCDETQGYLHSRPQPAEVLERWLDEHQPIVVTPARR